MQAIVVYRTNGIPSLRWEEVQEVRPFNNEVLIEVGATAVNRADLSQASGNYPPPPGVTDILGLEMAGTVIAIGAQVTKWRPGDKVFALLAGGGYAERTVVHEDMLIPMPDEWSFEQGAAIPEAWFTAYVNLFREGSLVAGETVLIHAGGSGVGTAAVQLATQSGATAFVTAGTSEKLAKCLSLGAEIAINYKEINFVDEVRAVSGSGGVDLILDPVGGSYLEDNVSLLNSGGRLINIGTLGGSSGTLNIGLLLGRSLRIIGSRLRGRPLEEKIAITRDFVAKYYPLFQDGRLIPVIDTVIPLKNAQKAHEYVRQNKNIGKVILSLE